MRHIKQCKNEMKFDSEFSEKIEKRMLFFPLLVAVTKPVNGNPSIKRLSPSSMVHV